MSELWDFIIYVCIPTSAYNAILLCFRQIYRLEPTEFGKNEMYRLIYHWFSSIFFIFLPVVILAIFNFFLIQAVRHSRDLRKTMTDQHQNSSVRHIQVGGDQL